MMMARLQHNILGTVGTIKDGGQALRFKVIPIFNVRVN